MIRACFSILMLVFFALPYGCGSTSPTDERRQVGQRPAEDTSARQAQPMNQPAAVKAIPQAQPGRGPALAPRIQNQGESGGEGKQLEPHQQMAADRSLKPQQPDSVAPRLESTALIARRMQLNLVPDAVLSPVAIFKIQHGGWKAVATQKSDDRTQEAMVISPTGAGDTLPRVFIAGRYGLVQDIETLLGDPRAAAIEFIQKVNPLLNDSSIASVEVDRENGVVRIETSQQLGEQRSASSIAWVYFGNVGNVLVQGLLDPGHRIAEQTEIVNTIGRSLVWQRGYGPRGEYPIKELGRSFILPKGWSGFNRLPVPQKHAELCKQLEIRGSRFYRLVARPYTQQKTPEAEADTVTIFWSSSEKEEIPLDTDGLIAIVAHAYPQAGVIASVEMEGGYELRFGQSESDLAIRLRVVMMNQRIAFAIQEGPNESPHWVAGEQLMAQVRR